MMRLTSGMMTLSTSDLMMVPKAAPMMTPTARSMTLPLKAKFLNSSNRLKAFFLGSRAARFLSGSITLPSTAGGWGLLLLLFHFVHDPGPGGVAADGVDPLLAVCSPTAHPPGRDYDATK